MKKQENEGMNQAAPVDHTDEKQDMELIKKILAEYLGEEEMENEEAVKACNEAFEAYKEMGMDEAESMKMAGSAMKLAKHMASKKVAKEAEPTDEKEEEIVEETTKESAEIAKLKGEIARLKESERKTALEKYLDEKLASLKESRRVTDEVRKLIGTPKSETHVDGVVASFMAGFSEASKVKKDTASYSFAECLEKNARPVHGEQRLGSFADCVK